MFCTQCGTRNPDDARFCKECGKNVDTAPPKLDESEFAMLQKPEDRLDDLLVQAFRRSELGDLEGAVQSCEEALSIRSDSTSAHSLLGMLYEKRGERDRAIQEFETVLALNPGSIADREKLEQLRDQTTSITPRHIVTAPRPSGPTIFDSPAGAFVGALAVFFLVLAAGGWALWAKTRTTESASRRTIGTPLPQIQNPLSTQLLPSNPQPANQAASSATRTAQNQATQQQNPILPNREAANEPVPNRQRRYDSDVPPARIDIADRQLPNRFEMRPTPDPGNTIHLPDNGLAPSEIGPSPASQADTRRTTPGRMDIIVSQSTPTTNKPVNTSGAAAPTDSSFDSRDRKTTAERARARGDYRTAAREYLKALDGAGDDAADIHYQLGRCYQFLEENESAISHYNDAIAEYRRQAAAGKNADEANRQIKRCETGIKACQ